MKHTAWLGILKRIPTTEHDGLVLMTNTGMELCVTNVVRMEEEYFILRGRPTGSTDQGRIFFVPYDQITYMGFNRAIKDDEFDALYGGTIPAEVVAAPQSEEGSVAEAEETESAVPPVVPPRPAAPAAPAPAAAPARPPLAAKAAILDRLRARSGTPVPKPPDKK